MKEPKYILDYKKESAEVIKGLLNESKYFANLRRNQKVFVIEYVNHNFNASKAMKASGYSGKSAGINAGRILRMETVQGAIKEYLEAVIDKYKSHLEHDILNMYMKRAFYNPATFINGDGSPKFDSLDELGDNAVIVEGIETKFFGKDANRSTVVVKLVDREKALLQLSKYLEIIKKADTTINNTLQVMGVMLTQTPQTKEEWIKDNAK